MTKQEQRGVVIAANKAVESLIPWWWKHYSNHANLPVTIFDLGLSEEGRNRCKKIGNLLPFSRPMDFVKPREKVADKTRNFWEKHWSPTLWHKRKAWFAKPFLMMDSPYTESLFIDLDCRIQGEITPLFDFLSKGKGFAIVKHQFLEGFYHNSGVFACEPHSPILTLWANECIKRSHLHMGDEDALHHLILTQKLPLTFFPLTYNHPYLFAGGEKAIIQHFLGLEGKKKIFLEP